MFFCPILERARRKKMSGSCRSACLFELAHGKLKQRQQWNRNNPDLAIVSWALNTNLFFSVSCDSQCDRNKPLCPFILQHIAHVSRNSYKLLAFISHHAWYENNISQFLGHTFTETRCERWKLACIHLAGLSLTLVIFLVVNRSSVIGPLGIWITEI